MKKLGKFVLARLGEQSTAAGASVMAGATTAAVAPVDWIQALGLLLAFVSGLYELLRKEKV